MEELKIIRDFSKNQLIDVIDIIYDSFRKKIEILELKPKSETQARRIMLASVNPKQIMILQHKKEVVGGLGIQTHDNKFYHFKWTLLKKEFGFFGAIQRALYQLIGNEHIKPSELYIGAIAISEHHRNKGYGAYLVKQIINHAKIQGYDKILLDVVNTNPRAHELYKKLGFIDVKYRKFGFLTRNAGFEGAYRMEFRSK